MDGIAQLMKRKSAGGVDKRAGKRAASDPTVVAFIMKQYGGGTGGSAGDACLLRLGDHALVVDFGKSKQRDALTAGLKGLPSYSAVVTHFHDDHCGSRKLRGAATELFIGPASTMGEHAHALGEANSQTPANDQLIWDKTAGNLRAKVWFIRGFGGIHNQSENAHSAGVYGEVQRDNGVVFRWASLGDMVPEAWPNVKSVLPGGVQLDLLKLPHHASPDNHMRELFSQHVNTDTVIVSSGFNNISGAWEKIKAANAALTKNQVRIVTYKRASDLGMTWEACVQPSNLVTVLGEVV